ncbi:MAG: ribbon-helix-helix domain-containing protein [Bifidobacteriaceae bacterium]|nr:ribbon-helix-helix domain-containing protein [Bifidobacteriaceae bacterium]
MKQVSAEEFDRIFDEGVEDIFDYVDWTRAYRDADPPQSVSVDLPDSVVASLDEQVARLGTSRSKLVEAWVREGLSKSSGQTAPLPGVGPRADRRCRRPAGGHNSRVPPSATSVAQVVHHTGDVGIGYAKLASVTAPAGGHPSVDAAMELKRRFIDPVLAGKARGG